MKKFLWNTILPLTMVLALQGCKKDEAGNCDDGKDNDKNGQVDCADAACSTDPACVTDEICDDGVDNDGDGDVDCNDSDCNNADGCVGGSCLAANECTGDNADCITETPGGFPGGYCVADCDPLNGDSDCAGGFCIDFGDGTGLCAGDCTVATQAQDCRAGYSCQDLGDGVQFACLPACTSDDQCLDAGNICLPDGSCGPDPAVACAAAAAIAVGTTTGDLTGGTDSLTGSCQQGGSAEDIFTFTPNANQVGTSLILTLSSDSDLGIYARTDCADENTEIDCADANFGGDTETIILDIANTSPITIVVDGFAAGEEGPYTLDIAAIVCGDGVFVGGVEGCDDGNTNAGDGCDAVCAVEGGFACDNTTSPSVCNLIVCGDGLIQGTEECDDANTNTGDGCDDVCAVEAGFLCQNQPSVCTDLNAVCASDSVNIPDINVATTGDNSAGSDLFNGSCTGGGLENIFSLVPGNAGETGTLTVVMVSATDLGVYARTTCADDNTELGCADAAFPGGNNPDTETLVVPIADASAAVSLFVDAFTAGDEGAYTLTTSFVADICGNGAATGGEACDDGNTTPGDGCSDVCTVEAGFACDNTVSPSVCTDLNAVCDAADAAVIGANNGDTTGGTELFIGPPGADAFADCPFTDIIGSGPEVLFSFTPAADGNLTLTLVSATDHGVYVRTTCVDDTTVVGCADAAFPGNQNGSEDTETTTIAVTGGVPLTIFVDAFLSTDAGAFVLTLQ